MLLGKAQVIYVSIMPADTLPQTNITDNHNPSGEHCFNDEIPIFLSLSITGYEMQKKYITKRFDGACKPMLNTAMLNTLRSRQNGRHFADDIFKRIFLNGNVWISINISLRFVPRGPINNIPALVQIMVWRRSGDKPLSETMVISWLTHICVTRPQWVNEAQA